MYWGGRTGACNLDWSLALVSTTFGLYVTSDQGYRWNIDFLRIGRRLCRGATNSIFHLPPSAHVSQCLIPGSQRPFSHLFLLKWDATYGIPGMEVLFLVIPCHNSQSASRRLR
jgi:hypothetical protein